MECKRRKEEGMEGGEKDRLRRMMRKRNVELPEKKLKIKDEKSKEIGKREGKAKLMQVK